MFYALENHNIISLRAYKEDSLKDDSKPTSNFFFSQWVLSYIDINQPWSYMYSPTSNLKLFFGGIYSITHNIDIYIEKRFIFNPLLSPPPVKYIYYKLL